MSNNINFEMEIEMAKILNAFIKANAHYFSGNVLEAVQKLMDEINKLETKDKGYLSDFKLDSI